MFTCEDVAVFSVKLKSIRRWYTAQPADGVCRNLVMTASVAFVASVFVATAAVFLQPQYAAQLAAVRQASMATLFETIPALESMVLSSSADSMETRLVELDSGCFVDDPDAASFDSRVAQNDPLLSREMDKSADGSNPLLKRRANYAQVHLLHEKDELRLLILPVYGPGYQSTLYAWLALAGDLDTVMALNVYEHAETPGIGSRVEDPAWQGLWKDKHLLDSEGQIAIKVVSQAADSLTLVDGISGATRTSLGVSNMVRYWVGTDGFGSLLDRLRRGESC